MGNASPAVDHRQLLSWFVGFGEWVQITLSDSISVQLLDKVAFGHSNSDMGLA